MARAANRQRGRERAALFVEIDPDIVRQVSEAAEDRAVNKWEIVEEALAVGLRQLAPPTDALFSTNRRTA